VSLFKTNYIILFLAAVSFYSPSCLCLYAMGYSALPSEGKLTEGLGPITCLTPGQTIPPELCSDLLHPWSHLED